MDKPEKNLGKRKKYFKKNCIHKESVTIIKSRNQCVNKSDSLKYDWNLYLPNESFEEYSHFNKKLKAIGDFFAKIEYSDLKQYSENHHFRVHVNEILKDKLFLSQWPDFISDLTNSPKLVIGLFSFSMDQLIKSKGLNNEINDDEFNFTHNTEIIPVTYNARFVGLQNNLAFKELKVHNYGKFVTLIGTVIRVGDIKPFCTRIAFKCLKCQTVEVVFQNNGCYTLPNTCRGDSCFSRIFKPLLNSPLTQTIPKKYVRLQEMNMDLSEGGRIPRTVECELTLDLTDSCVPGDKVIISGIVTTNVTDERKKIGKDSFSYVLHVSANSVVCLKGNHVDSMGPHSTGYSEWKSEDLEAIKEIPTEINRFKLVVLSLCPNIYGHELIKAGLVLALFGGRNKFEKEGKEAEFSIRENSHILIVGDPGIGKSQMLLACTDVSPRGIYVCGNSTTSSGLTVTISKDSGKNSLEAGALVLADQGHCCIDEFDKMKHQHSALLEAMEQQTISMAKSGVVCTLPARTSILAAANPSDGHYNRAKTVSENLKMGGSLLSRFDIVFIVEDQPDLDFDAKMSKHIMGLHTVAPEDRNNCSSVNFNKNDVSGSKLLKMLRIEPNEKVNYMSPQLLQKYISYARKSVQPKLTPEVSTILKKFYLDMRRQNKLSYSIPITIRQLESLIRLTKARARIELRAFCIKSDAEEVIEIIKYSMRETYSDEFGNLDFERSIHGSGMSKSSQAKQLINLMTKVASNRGDDYFTKTEIQQLGNKLKISLDSLYPIIDTLNIEGILLKKGYDLYQIQTL